MIASDATLPNAPRRLTRSLVDQPLAPVLRGSRAQGSLKLLSPAGPDGADRGVFSARGNSPGLLQYTPVGSAPPPL
ncbi:hypothetical protein NDU88_006473 [Pleurodeles waltl]|uniref:Uncharacterized protein n=1 Tax=Pleurodeles waltl TaxID=8319 RepID=A0AAV7QP20_PLEWA|nr:hypothetical protein NDU88_006473 [Pleurodeles waltl]